MALVKRRSIIAAAGAAAMLAVGPTAALAAGPTSVSVRIEGASRTLLRATTVRTHSGSITKGHTPAKACPATTAAGALDVATHHNWNGTYGSYGLSVTSILGEAHPFTSSKYWSIFVNNKYASSGICGLQLRKGEKILFAAVPDKGTEFPIVLSAPAHSGSTFTVKASYFNAKNVSKPLSGVLIKGIGHTNAKGLATAHVTKTGTLTMTATKAGFIRAEASVSIS